jgi:hypothetical protein
VVLYYNSPRKLIYLPHENCYISILYVRLEPDLSSAIRINLRCQEIYELEKWETFLAPYILQTKPVFCWRYITSFKEHAEDLEFSLTICLLPVSMKQSPIGNVKF